MPAQSLAHRIEELARKRPLEPAIVAPHDTLTWSAYDERSQALARAFAACGFKTGERVAVWLPDGPGVHVAFVAGEKAGLSILGIGPRAGFEEVAHLMAQTGAVSLVSRSHQGEVDTRDLYHELVGRGLPLRGHFVVPNELAIGDDLLFEDRSISGSGSDSSMDALLAERRLGVEDLFLLNSTSGTTGMPKCVRHDQLRWMRFHDLAVEAADLSSDDIFLSALPTPFGFGIWTAHVTPTLLGVPTVQLPRFSPEEVLAQIERHRVSVLAAVSTQFIMMLDSAAIDQHDLGSLRVLFTGGEAVPFDRAVDFEARSGAKVLQFYGSNETGAVSRTTLRDPREKRLRTAGRPIEAMQLRLLDEEGRNVTDRGRGQPVCKGPLLSGGYDNDLAANEELRTPDGFFRLGDIVELDREGYLHVIGRADDFIIRGGKNISGPAVEAAVATHPAVRLAAAVAMPDATYGERVCVFVELRPGNKIRLEDLVDHLRATGISVENWPERLVVMAALPRGSGGKIAKQALRDEIRRTRARETDLKATGSGTRPPFDG